MQTVEEIKQLLHRNKLRLHQELLQSKEAYHLIKKSTHSHLTEEEKQNMLWEIVQQTSHKMTRIIGSHELTLDENYKTTNNREKQSLWGLVRVFNCIPIGIIERETKVQRFQSKLSDFAKEQASKKRENWQHVFSPRHDTFRKNSLSFKWSHKLSHASFSPFFLFPVMYIAQAHLGTWPNPETTDSGMPCSLSGNWIQFPKWIVCHSGEKTGPMKAWALQQNPSLRFCRAQKGRDIRATMCEECVATIDFIEEKDAEWLTAEHLLAKRVHVGHHNEELMRNGWYDTPLTPAQISHVIQQVQFRIACESEMKTRFIQPSVFRPQ